MLRFVQNLQHKDKESKLGWTTLLHFRCSKLSFASRSDTNCARNRPFPHKLLKSENVLDIQSEEHPEFSKYVRFGWKIEQNEKKYSPVKFILLCYARKRLTTLQHSGKSLKSSFLRLKLWNNTTQIVQLTCCLITQRLKD